MKKALAILLTLCMALALLSGCGSTASPEPESPAAGTAAETKTTAPASTEKKDSYKIGFVSWSIGHTVPAAWDQGMRGVFDLFPKYEYTAFDGEASAETQNRIMSDLINQGYDVIVLQAADGAALASSVTEAEEAGIPVICLNLDASCEHTCFVSMAAYEAGYAVAKAMGEQMGGTGNVVIIQGVIGTSSQTYREAGFRDAMSELYPTIEILAAQPADWDKETAINVMNDFMQAYEKIDGVFGVNDSMAEGAAIAAEAAGRLDDMVIWGDDGERDALVMIEEGKLDGTIYTNCFDQGAVAAQFAMWLCDSGFVPGSTTRTGTIDMEYIVVTAENVAEIAEEDRW